MTSGNGDLSAPAPLFVSVSLEARPENAWIARATVAELTQRGGLADRLGADAEVVVTEAFANAARHAYTGREQVAIETRADDRGVTITVRDWEGGLRPRISYAEHDGLGLGLIAALSDIVRMRRLPDDRTELLARLDSESPKRPS